MSTPAAGEVALVPFPFSDLSQSKVRPAVCLADAGRGDWVLCQITSSPYGDPAATALDAPDFASALARFGAGMAGRECSTAETGVAPDLGGVPTSPGSAAPQPPRRVS